MRGRTHHRVPTAAPSTASRASPILLSCWRSPFSAECCDSGISPNPALWGDEAATYSRICGDVPGSDRSSFSSTASFRCITRCINWIDVGHAVVGEDRACGPVKPRPPARRDSFARSQPAKPTNLATDDQAISRRRTSDRSRRRAHDAVRHAPGPRDRRAR